MTISLGWFITLCIFGLFGFATVCVFLYIIVFEIGEMIANYRKYKDYYFENNNTSFLEEIRKNIDELKINESTEDSEVEEDE